MSEYGVLDTTRERAELVEQWAHLHGDDLAGVLRLDPDDDAETLRVLHNALWLAGDVLLLLPATEAAP